jgi:hypothetical protein
MNLSYNLNLIRVVRGKRNIELHQSITGMNSELAKKKHTQFKLLKPRASNDEFWAFNSPI